MRKFKIKLIGKILLPIILLLIVSSQVYAVGGSFQLPTFLDKYTVYSNGSSSLPAGSSYPYNNSNVTAIAFDNLYGGSKDLIEYYGEVPYNIKDENGMGQYRVFNGTKIDSSERLWSNGKGELPIGTSDVTTNNKDPHISSMTVSHDVFNIGSLAFGILSGISFLASMLVNLIITIKSINIATILNSIDSTGTLSNQLSAIFLLDPKTGKISPLLVFSIAIFIITLVSLGFKMLKGTGTLKAFLNEVAFLLAALVITSMFLTSNNATKIGGIGIDFITSFTTQLASNSSDATSIFSYSTSDSVNDAPATQKALISKTYIDQVIYAQLGYSINDLYLVNNDGSNGSFGSKQEVLQAIQKTIGSKATIDGLSICTDNSGKRKVNNLGYYLWAANSGVSISNGKGSQAPFYNAGNETTVRTGSSDRVLLVVDFLSNLRQIQSEKGNNAIVNKIDKIMSNLQSPSYSYASCSIFAIILLNLALCYSLILVTLFCIIGEVIIVFGGFGMVIMPILLLFNKTRNTAKKIMWSYEFGFVRYLIGCAIFNSIVLIDVLLCEKGLPGIVIAILLNLLLGKFAPALIKELNTYISSFGRGKELSFMSRFYNDMNRRMASNKRTKGRANIIGDDGFVTTVDDQKRKAQKGRDKNAFRTDDELDKNLNHGDNDESNKEKDLENNNPNETISKDRNIMNETNEKSDNSLENTVIDDKDIHGVQVNDKDDEMSNSSIIKTQKGDTTKSRNNFVENDDDEELSSIYDDNDGKNILDMTKEDQDRKEKDNNNSDNFSLHKEVAIDKKSNDDIKIDNEKNINTDLNNIKPKETIQILGDNDNIKVDNLNSDKNLSPKDVSNSATVEQNIKNGTNNSKTQSNKDNANNSKTQSNKDDKSKLQGETKENQTKQKDNKIQELIDKASGKGYKNNTTTNQFSDDQDSNLIDANVKTENSNKKDNNVKQDKSEIKNNLKKEKNDNKFKEAEKENNKSNISTDNVVIPPVKNQNTNTINVNDNSNNIANEPKSNHVDDKKNDSNEKPKETLKLNRNSKSSKIEDLKENANKTTTTKNTKQEKTNTNKFNDTNNNNSNNNNNQTSKATNTTNNKKIEQEKNKNNTNNSSNTNNSNSKNSNKNQNEKPTNSASKKIKLKLTNAALQAVDNVPIIGHSINKMAAKQIEKNIQNSKMSSNESNNKSDQNNETKKIKFNFKNRKED